MYQRKPPKYNHNVKPMVMLWSVLVADIKKPYRLIRLANMNRKEIAAAKKRGYFTEQMTARINNATCHRLKLHTIDHAKKLIADQEQMQDMNCTPD